VVFLNFEINFNKKILIFYKFLTSSHRQIPEAAGKRKTNFKSYLTNSVNIVGGNKAVKSINYFNLKVHQN
jgi:hypothetical protein